jgi:hypothetical protein
MDNFRISRTISNFHGQFQNFVDSFYFWRTILIFCGQFQKFEKFGGPPWKFVDNFPRTIVVHGQLSTKVPRPVYHV